MGTAKLHLSLIWDRQTDGRTDTLLLQRPRSLRRAGKNEVSLLCYGQRTTGVLPADSLLFQ